MGSSQPRDETCVSCLLCSLLHSLSPTWKPTQIRIWLQTWKWLRIPQGTVIWLSIEFSIPWESSGIECTEAVERKIWWWQRSEGTRGTSEYRWVRRNLCLFTWPSELLTFSGSSKPTLSGNLKQWGIYWNTSGTHMKVSMNDCSTKCLRITGAPRSLNNNPRPCFLQPCD